MKKYMLFLLLLSAALTGCADKKGDSVEMTSAHALITNTKPLPSSDAMQTIEQYYNLMKAEDYNLTFEFSSNEYPKDETARKTYIELSMSHKPLDLIDHFTIEIFDGKTIQPNETNAIITLIGTKNNKSAKAYHYMKLSREDQVWRVKQLTPFNIKEIDKIKDGNAPSMPPD